MKRVRLSLNILVNVNEKIKDIYFGQFLNSRVFILGGSSWETNAEFCTLHTIKSQSYLKDFFAYSGESNVVRKDQLLYCYAGLYPKYNQVLCKGDFPYYFWRVKLFSIFLSIVFAAVFCICITRKTYDVQLYSKPKLRIHFLSKKKRNLQKMFVCKYFASTNTILYFSF